MLSQKEKMHLTYLSKSPIPLWGGHLKRGEQLNDADMMRWLKLGLIRAEGMHGYVITDAGVAALESNLQ